MVDGSSRTLPAASYFDAAVYDRERRSIFAAEWLWFACESELETPGSYVAREYAGWRLMVVRAPDGQLRGFHNVCRHRAGPLVDDGAGSCANLVCRYHGWSYAFDGQLRSARDFGVEFDHDEYALLGIRVEMWRGQVFVNLDAGAPSLLEDLRDFFEEAAGFSVESMQLVRLAHHDLACNWKTYADNYLEGYHIPMMHPMLNRMYDAKRYDVVLGDRYCRHSAPARNGGDVNGRWLYRWPNLALNIYGDSMNVEVIVPTGPRTCRVLYVHLFLSLDDPDIDQVIRFSDEVMEEDRAMVEVVQHNLESGAYTDGLLSPKHEHAVAQFQDLVRRSSGETI